MSHCSGSLDSVVGVVANRSRGKVCNLCSLSLLNSINLSSLYSILALDITWDIDLAKENRSSNISSL